MALGGSKAYTARGNRQAAGLRMARRRLALGLTVLQGQTGPCGIDPALWRTDCTWA